MELRIPKDLMAFEEAYATEEQCLAGLCRKQVAGSA